MEDKSTFITQKQNDPEVNSEKTKYFDHFTVEHTKDGSPTLRLISKSTEESLNARRPDDSDSEALSQAIKSPPPPEAMHHSSGAASETLYIYIKPIFAALQIFHRFKDELKSENHQKPMVQQNFLYSKSDFQLSVIGLGLGYIEMGSALVYLLHQTHLQNLKIETYESVKALEEGFQKWTAKDKEAHALYKEVFLHLQDKIKSLDFAKDQQNNENNHSVHNNQNIHCNQLTHKVDHQLDHALMQNAQTFLNNNLTYRGSFSIENCRHIMSHSDFSKYNYVAFDAFSKSTHADAWSPEFLNFFLSQMCAEDCVLSTYACTRVLKETLKNQGFLFIKRPGFIGKRDSTLAVRGVFKSRWDFFESVLRNLQ